MIENLNGLFSTIETIRGIPLTEDWLLRFGFEEKEVKDCFSMEVLSRGNINAYLEMDGIKIELGTQGGYMFGVTGIKHIHQLQNLFYSLTQQELKLQK